MKSKIKSLKKLFQSSTTAADNFTIPERFLDYCDGDNMPVGLFQKQSHKFRFYFTKYPQLQHPSDCIKELDGTPETKASYVSFEVVYNSIQQKLFQQLYHSVFEFDNTWFQQNDHFLQQLPTQYKFALVAMTNKSQQHIQAYLKNENLERFHQRVRQWKPNIHGYLPIFFPLYEKNKPIFRKQQITNLSEIYQYVIDTICPSLSNQEIDECVVELVKQVRHVFSICPKTTKKITLWRGIRSHPSFSYAGFTSMSLNPFHTLHYTSENCCLQKITILPHTPLLFIGGLSSFKNELECVLPDNLQFYEIKKSMENIPIVKEMKTKCPDSKEMKRILIQHVVVL